MPHIERQPVRKKSKPTMIFFGSTVAVLGSLCAWPRSRKFLSALGTRITLQIKLTLLAIQGTYYDVRDAKYNKFDLPRKTDRTAIVTGGSRGIGVEVVRMLLKCDMKVIIACRNTAAGHAVIDKIRESGVKDGTAVVYELDNSSFVSVKKFADTVKHDFTHIDVLINNAGVMFPPYSETVDGFEQQLGVNYLSHFLLTALLMPLLRNASMASNSGARVINVSSIAHVTGTINFDDINYKNQWVTTAAYSQSKLAALMFTKSLQQLFDEKKLNIRSYAVHPGIVDTDLFKNTPLRLIKFLTKYLLKYSVSDKHCKMLFSATTDLSDIIREVFQQACSEYFTAFIRKIKRDGEHYFSYLPRTCSNLRETNDTEHIILNKKLRRRHATSPVQGATPIVYSALSDDIKDKGGIYISNCRETFVKPMANDKAICDRLFKLSLQLTRLRDFFQYL